MFSFKPKASQPKYNYQEVFQRLLSHVEVKPDNPDHLMHVLKSVAFFTHAEDVSLYLFQKNTSLFILKSFTGNKPYHVSIAANHEFLNWLKKVGVPAFKDRFVTDKSQVDLKTSALHFFTQTSSMMVIPLVMNDSWIGLVNIGRFLNQRDITKDDEDFFNLVGPWLSLMISQSLKVTKLIDENKKLKETVDLHTQSMSSVTEDLLEPAKGIMSMAALLLDQSVGEINHDQRRYLEMLHSAAEGIADSVKQSLSLVSVTGKRHEIRKLDLTGIIQEIGTIYHNVISENGNRFHVHVSPQTIVYGNDSQVRTVFLNLVDHAVHSTRNGQIEVHATKSGDMVKVCIKDTGSGLTRDEERYLVEEMDHLSDAADKGLGFVLSRKIVEQHGGRIWAESIAGKGAEIYFSLPSKPL